MTTRGAQPNIWTARTMFDVAVIVSDAMRDVERRDSEYLEANDIEFNASFILGGQIAGEPMRLFRIYAEGNFIEAGSDTQFFQTGEAKYGKPIIDRVIRPATDLADAAKCVLVSFDSTMRSNLSVGMPIDLICYERDSLMVTHAPPLRAARCVLRRAQQRLERRYARRYSRNCRNCVGSPYDIPAHYLRARRQSHSRCATNRCLRGARRCSNSHRGYDPGALPMARAARAAIFGRRSSTPPSAACSSTSIARSATARSTPTPRAGSHAPSTHTFSRGTMFRIATKSRRLSPTPSLPDSAWFISHRTASRRSSTIACAMRTSGCSTIRRVRASARFARVWTRTAGPPSHRCAFVATTRTRAATMG